MASVVVRSIEDRDQSECHSRIAEIGCRMCARQRPIFACATQRPFPTPALPPTPTPTPPPQPLREEENEYEGHDLADAVNAVTRQRRHRRAETDDAEGDAGNAAEVARQAVHATLQVAVAIAADDADREALLVQRRRQQGQRGGEESP